MGGFLREVFIMEEKKVKTTEAQRQAASRYKSKFVELRIRVTPDFKFKLQDLAKSSDKSLNQFVLDLIFKSLG